MSEYLWDGAGEPDPEIVRLEAVLRPLRRLPPAPALEARAPRPWLEWPALAAAAAVVLALLPLTTRTSPPGAGEAWQVEWLHASGTPDRREGRIAAGEWLDTGEGRARLDVGRIGQVVLEPSTRVGLVDTGRRAHRLSLARGTLHAMIWAPPGQFVVDTPAARAVDLGCEYTLTVGADGTGLLRVETGWVGFEYHRLQSLVPAGAVCRTYGGRGPGTPRFESATAHFAQALDELDSGARDGRVAAALSRVLAEARPRDALSLWHLLSRVDPPDRGSIWDRLATLVPPPDGVTREGIVAGDTAMLERWWDELGFGSSEFWRDWTRRWSDVEPTLPAEARRANTSR
ncbi:MAG TPA: hypothetical protein VMX54_19600 [Vicinamibacteria bacterium]|nr:hypothetical protein [Vicinamibacteria bacterium]